MAVVCLVSGFALVPGAVAAPTPTPSAPKLISESEALELAKSSGVPVIVSSMTDERTLVTADPQTGQLVAELSANVARVPDSRGGWRAPSAALVKGADGLLRPEAALIDVALSAGGPTSPAVAVTDGSASWRFGWPAALPVPVVDGARATYPEVYPGVDLVVEAGIESVETHLVVKTREASTNPAVRTWSMPSQLSKGLTGKPLKNGATSVVDESGSERFRVAPPLMWDSSGTPFDKRFSDRPVEPRVSPIAADVSAGRLTVQPVASFLDDPATVYPVVIDPEVSLSQTHVLRVTDDWAKWDDAVGDHGKVGYNGWDAPYYRSRMFYQFSWPKNADGKYITSAQIAAGKFEYVQDHSPQHPPNCESSSHSYPAVRAKLANAISKDDKWADRTGSAWHPQASVPNWYAVGHETYCNKTKVEIWDLTGALREERVNYGSRTTVTVGLYSDDETDAMGWKHYVNAGTSPRLLLKYEKEPLVPALSSVVVNPEVTPLVSPRTALSRSLTLSAIPTLEGGAGCGIPTDCAYVQFEVTGNSFSWTGDGTWVPSGALSTAFPPTLAPGNYSVRLRAWNRRTGLASAWSSTIPLKVDPAPSSPTWSWAPPVVQSSGSLPSGVPLQINAAAAPTDSDVTQLCAVVAADSSSTEVCAPTSGAPATATITLPAFSPGVYQVRVVAKDAYQTSAPALDSPGATRTVSW